MRQEVSFHSSDTLCRAWFEAPTNHARPLPLVIMGHGFGGTRGMRLQQYAERFHTLGFATLIFDYRHWGASEGEPRNLLDPEREIDDWQAALAFARRLPQVDPQRIVLWGTSFAGGLVLSVAARDGGIAATISQCPMLDGQAAALTALRTNGLRFTLRLAALGLTDRLRRALGATAQYIPIIAQPGKLAAMNTADAWQRYRELTADVPEFENRVTAGTVLAVPFYRPVLNAARVTCPALIQICEHDSVAPAAAAERAAAGLPQATVVRYPIGHFDVYFGADFERSVADQLAFLRRTVLGETPT